MREHVEGIDDQLEIELIRANIQFPRVKIVKETPEAFEVKLGDKNYKISKGANTEFVMGSVGSTSMGLRQELRQVIELKTEIFQETTAPKEFMEVMIFHELREMEYVEGGFEDAHDRAVHDETLYVIKYFEKDKRERYFKFAANLRRDAGERKLEEEKAEKLRLRTEEKDRRTQEAAAKKALEAAAVQRERTELMRRIEHVRKTRQFWTNRPDLAESMKTEAVLRRKAGPEVKSDDVGINVKGWLSYDEFDNTIEKVLTDESKTQAWIQRIYSSAKEGTFSLKSIEGAFTFLKKETLRPKWGGVQGRTLDLAKAFKVFYSERMPMEFSGVQSVVQLPQESLNYLEQLVLLFEGLLDAAEKQELTRDFLHETAIKVKALIGVKMEPCFFYNDEEEESFKSKRAEKVAREKTESTEVQERGKRFRAERPELQLFEALAARGLEDPEVQKWGNDLENFSFKCDESILGSNERTEAFIQMVNEAVDKSPANTPSLMVLCGWKEVPRLAENNFAELRSILTRRWYTRKGGLTGVSANENDHLNAFIKLYEEVEEKARAKKLTREFLIEASIKSKAVIFGFRKHSNRYFAEEFVSESDD